MSPFSLPDLPTLQASSEKALNARKGRLDKFLELTQEPGVQKWFVHLQSKYGHVKLKFGNRKFQDSVVPELGQDSIPPRTTQEEYVFCDYLHQHQKRAKQGHKVSVLLLLGIRQVLYLLHDCNTHLLLLQDIELPSFDPPQGQQLQDQHTDNAQQPPECQSVGSLATPTCSSAQPAGPSSHPGDTAAPSSSSSSSQQSVAAEEDYLVYGYTHPSVRLQRLSEQNYGMFVSDSIGASVIPKGTIITSWSGRLIHRYHVDKMDSSVSANSTRYIIRIPESDYFVDGSHLRDGLVREYDEGKQEKLDRTGAGFMLNSAARGDANCRDDDITQKQYYDKVVGVRPPEVNGKTSQLNPRVIVIKTNRDVSAGEQLTFNYAVTE